MNDATIETRQSDSSTGAAPRRENAFVAALHGVAAEWQTFSAAWDAGDPFYRLTTGIITFLIVLGVVLRIRGIADPPFLTFDEHHFVPNASHYLVGLADQNDHPPVGKLLIAVGMLLFGYDSLGWRFASLCFGLHQLVIGYWLGSRLFESRRAGAMVAAFLAADGFFIAYSRCGLMDGVLTCIIQWAVLAAVVATRTRHVLVSALLCGVAMSVKWSGAMAVVPAAAAVWTLGRSRKANVLCFALTPVIHALIWMGGLALTHQPSDPQSLWHVARGLFLHHIEIGKQPNPLASPWYTWLYLRHPIVVKLSSHGLGQRYASSAGNVLLWASVSALALGGPLFAVFVWARRRLGAKRGDDTRRDPFLLRALLLWLGWAALLLPWILGRGQGTYNYHYLPSYGFGLVLVGGVVARLERRHTRAAFAYLALVAGISIYFAPVWSEATLGDAAANRRLIFVPWRP